MLGHNSVDSGGAETDRNPQALQLPAIHQELYDMNFSLKNMPVPNRVKSRSSGIDILDHSLELSTTTLNIFHSFQQNEEVALEKDRHPRLILWSCPRPR